LSKLVPAHGGGGLKPLLLEGEARREEATKELSGVLRYGGVVADLDASPDAVITSLTVQPTSGLEYGATYRLDLGEGIEDLDTTASGGSCAPSRCLVPYWTEFTTFSPTSLSEDPESFGSPGIVILGERAYLVQNYFHSGTLRVFETTDPVSPQEIPNGDSDSRDPRFTISYRPVDLVGESESPLTGGQVVAVATGPTAQSKPSNVWLLDVSDDRKTEWIGAVSLTKSAADGYINRTFLRAGVLYSATFRKGIQVVDLGKVKDAFKAPGTSEYYQMVQAFLTDGQGYGLENVIGIRVDSPFGGPARLNDIEAALVQTTGGAQVLVAAAGDPGLTVVNPASQSVLWNDKVKYERDEGGQKVVAATLRYGQAIALGNVAGRDLAVLVGTGTIEQDTQARPLLMVVGLTDPSHPMGLGYVKLDDATVIDVILKDDLALLGGSKQVTLVSLTDPAHPAVIGTVQGVGGRLAVGENGSILFSTERSVFGGSDLPLGGVRTAALGSLAIIKKVTPVIVPVDSSGITTAPIEVTYRLIAPPDGLAAVEVRVNREAEALGAYAGPGIVDGTFDVIIPPGLPFKPPVERLELSLPLADGSPGDGVVAYVKDQDKAGGGSIVVNPVFERLAPGLAAKGSAAVSVVIEGRSLGGMSAVFVRRVAGAPPEGAGEAEEGQSVDEWTAAKVVSGDQQSISIQLPPEVLTEEGFLLIAPVADPERGLAFVVFDAAAPAAGSSLDIRLTAVLPGELGTPGTSLHVEGSGFVDGVVAVVGRGGRMAQRLETVVEDATSLDVALPPEYLGSADDLILAVLSPDGSSLSNGLPMRSPVREVDNTVPLGVDPGEVAITGVGGSLVWNKPGQELTIEGVGLTPGMEILLTAGDNTVPLFAQAAGSQATTTMRTAQASTQATTARVKVLIPDTHTKWPLFCLELGLDFLSTTTTPIPMAARCIGAQWPALVPVGGRRKFVAYAGNDDQVYIFPEDDPEVGEATEPIPCQGRVVTKPTSVASARATGGQRLSPLLPEDIVFEFSVPSIDHPFGDPTQLDRIPLVEREYNRCDPENPNVLYLRGVRPNAPGEEFEITARPVARPPLLAPREGRLKVVVGLGQLSGASPVSAKLDKKINQAGGATGVPPQLLKGQASVETELNADLYRYEPMTIDFMDLGSEVAAQRNDPYYRRHLLPGTAVATYGQRQCVALRGPEAPADPEPGCTPVDATQAHVGPVSFADPSVRVRGRVGLPIVNKQFNPGWRQPPISADRVYTIQGVTQIANPTRIEPRFHSDAQPEPPVTPVNDKQFNRGPQNNEYQVDFMNNTVRLGQPLARGEWIRLRYERMFEQTVGPAAGDPADAGRCGLDFDVTTLTEKTQKYNGPTGQKRGLNFAPNDSIGSFLRRNASDQGRFAQQGGINPGGGPVFRWLNGTDSEQRIEFARDDSGARTSTVIDPRFEMATAQFIAAGSFGLYQATLKDWDNIDHRAEILNRVFDLNNRCLFELMTNTGSRYREASLLAGARHSWARKQKRVQYTCDTPGRCDQVDWAKRWSKILWLYNTANEKYDFIKRDSKGKPIGTKLFNKPVERGVEDFDVR
jgi:hypothetical protein